MRAFDDRLLVVAGTDTEIGKTTVACAVLDALWRAGREVRGIKPVESGIELHEDPSDEDGYRLAEASGQDAPRRALQRLKAPIAPPVAARDEGVELRPDRWLQRIRDLREEAELTLVEGAGGLLSPLADGFDTRTLAVALEAPVLLVASDSLGTLNHLFLTHEALRASGCEVVGVVFSAPALADASTGRNAAEVAEHFGDIPIASLPRVSDTTQGAKALEGFCEELWRRVKE